MTPTVTPAAGTCRYCRCTEEQACDGGCGWSDDAQTICTLCAESARIAAELVAILGVVATHPKAGIRLATAKWDLLPLEQQLVLVMTCRATIEGIRAAILEALGEDAVAAGVELNIITGFLLEQFPDKVTDADTASSAVMRLLQPHIGSRIVMPSGVLP